VTLNMQIVELKKVKDHNNFAKLSKQAYSIYCKLRVIAKNAATLCNMKRSSTDWNGSRGESKPERPGTMFR